MDEAGRYSLGIGLDKLVFDSLTGAEEPGNPLARIDGWTIGPRFTLNFGRLKLWLETGFGDLDAHYKSSFVNERPFDDETPGSLLNMGAGLAFDLYKSEATEFSLYARSQYLCLDGQWANRRGWQSGAFTTLYGLSLTFYPDAWRPSYVPDRTVVYIDTYQSSRALADTGRFLVEVAPELGRALTQIIFRSILH